MYKVKALNKIDAKGLEKLPSDIFELDNATDAPDAVLLRSASMHEFDLKENLLCIARAGAGVNNIPTELCAQKGIVVFNTPGANANAVREIAVCALLLASRDIVGGINWAKALAGDDVPAQVEKGKGNFSGPEISGKTLGVIGLGAIGAGVATAACYLGMKVLGFDPYLTPEAAGKIHPEVKRVDGIEKIFAESDYISVHVPLNKETKEYLAPMLSKVKPGLRLINFSRGDLFNDADMLSALENGMVARYVTDFPNAALLANANVIPMPHLGASTPESEENCAVMAADQLREYMLYGNIKNSVNLPNSEVPYKSGRRLCVIHSADTKIEIAAEAVSVRTKGNYGYTVLDGVSGSDEIVSALRAKDGVLRVRSIEL